MCVSDKKLVSILPGLNVAMLDKVQRLMRAPVMGKLMRDLK